MTDDALPDPQLIDRYLADSLSRDERAQMESWLSEHDVTAAMLRAMPRALAGEADAPDTDASWQRLSERISAADSHDALAVRRARRVAAPAPQPWLRRAAQMAAALVIVIGGVATWRGVHGAGGSLTAPLGHDVTATLPDGTRMTLAAGSSASWPRAYGSVSRDITLHGEARFDVVHDATHPFRVHTRDAVAEDVGTRFVVRAWAELGAVEVAVEEGIVALADSAHTSADRGTLLHAGQLGRLVAGKVMTSTDTDVAMAWTRGALAFDNQPLAEVLPAIGRRFDIVLQADPALATRRLTARFTTQSLDEVLRTLTLALDVNVVTKGRLITLAPVSR